MRRFFCLVLALAVTTAFGGTYRWIDPATGRTMISDTPPPGGARQVSRRDPADAEGERLAFAAKRAAEYFPVTLYTAPDCVAECKEARELLNGRGVPFAEKMLQKPEDIAELKQFLGDAFVPTLKVGRQPVRGFQAEAYHNLLDLAGYPKSAPYGSKPSGGLAR